MLTIDADAHVLETEHTWDYLDPYDRKYRPQLVSPRGEARPERWLIDGKLVIGTDYGHFDASSELDAITILKNSKEIPETAIANIVEANPKALYGL